MLISSIATVNVHSCCFYSCWSCSCCYCCCSYSCCCCWHFCFGNIVAGRWLPNNQPTHVPGLNFLGQLGAVTYLPPKMRLGVAVAWDGKLFMQIKCLRLTRVRSVCFEAVSRCCLWINCLNFSLNFSLSAFHWPQCSSKQTPNENAAHFVSCFSRQRHAWQRETNIVQHDFRIPALRFQLSLKFDLFNINFSKSFLWCIIAKLECLKLIEIWNLAKC